MNIYKKYISITRKRKFRAITGVILFITLFSVSCKTNNEDINDEYYVKYEVESKTIYYGGKLDVTLNTETNELTTMIIDQRKVFETVVGPVKKGFNAKLNVLAKGTTHNQLKLKANIYVSKNNSPFANKKSDLGDQPRDSLQINYTIDF